MDDPLFNGGVDAHISWGSEYDRTRYIHNWVIEIDVVGGERYQSVMAVSPEMIEQSGVGFDIIERNSQDMLFDVVNQVVENEILAVGNGDEPKGF